jgi:sulfite reductase beta subunit-like hemoprotein
MAFGRRGLSIEEDDDYKMLRRARPKGILKGWQMKTVANCVSDCNAAHGSSESVMEVTKAIEQIFP